MRVRVVLAVGLLGVLLALLIDMSGSAPRIAGTDHVQPSAFVATLKGDQELCQPGMVLPSDAGSMQLLAGTYGAPVPEVTVRFLSSSGAVVSRGTLPAGQHEGLLTVPLSHPHGPAVAGTLCVRVVHSPLMVLGGSPSTAGATSERVQGVPQAGLIQVIFLRPGSESWWELLPTLTRRFGLGKSTVFGVWTLPVAVLALIGVWFAAFRLLVRELV